MHSGGTQAELVRQASAPAPFVVAGSQTLPANGSGGGFVVAGSQTMAPASNPGGAHVCAICGNSYPLASDLQIHHDRRHASY